MSLCRISYLKHNPLNRQLISPTSQIIINQSSSKSYKSSTSETLCYKYKLAPKTLTNLHRPASQTRCPSSRQSPDSSIFIPLFQQQIREFQTWSQRSVSAKDSSDVLAKSTLKFSEPPADIIGQNGPVYGDLHEVHSKSSKIDKHEVCLKLQNERFNNHRLAFAWKTTFELTRSMFFFSLFRFQFITDNSEKILHLMKKALGERMADYLIKRMIYDHYVAGETKDEVREVVSRLKKNGVGPLIAVPIEDDISHSDGIQANDKDAIMDINCDKTLDSMDLCANIVGSEPMFQIRMSALLSPELMQILSKACMSTGNSDSSAMSIESLQALVQGIQGKAMDIPKTKEWDNVMVHMQEFQRMLKRLRTITDRMLEGSMVGMVDAEYTYFNPAIRHLTFAMMEICNKNKPLAFYTYQAYLKSTYGYLVSDLNLAKRRGICFGAKLVRGAYIVKERSKAKREGYPDPVNDSFEATSKEYHRCLDELTLAASENQDRIRFIIASHNEDTVRYAFKRMSSLGLPADSKAVLFGQLYGMADHVSYTLGAYGVNVVKSLPIGSVEDTIPYLSRRSQENRSIFENVRNEKQQVKKALKERIFRN